MDSERDILERMREIRETAAGFRRAQIYITFARLGIAHALETRSLSLDRLADACGADRAALERFSHASIAFPLLRVNDHGQLALTDVSRRAFLPNSEHSIANLLRLEGAFYERWGRLEQAVRTGGRPPENRAQEDDPDWVRMFTLALYDNARRTAPAVAGAIDRALPPRGNPIRIIDVGGSHGAYSLALAERCLDVEAVVFDLPPVIEVTRSILAESAVADRVSAIAGDFHHDPLGSNFDAALLFGVLHGETSDNAEQLLETIRASLAPGGLLLIRSQGQSRGESAPGEREIVDLHMLLSTDGGEVRRSRDTKELVTSHGFRAESPVEIQEPGGGQLLVFQKSS